VYTTTHTQTHLTINFKTRKQRTGEITIGPTACLAFSREGYSLFDINYTDLKEILMFPGLYRFLFKHWRPCLSQLLRECSPLLTINAVQRFCPSLRVRDVVFHTSGVRGQSMAANGTFLDDFVYEHQSSSILHVRNAPSPAATASLSLATDIVDNIIPMLDTRSVGSAS